MLRSRIAFIYGKVAHKSLSSWGRKNKTHTAHFSLAIMCGKWLFAFLTWPVLRPGFRRWWPLFAVRYPLCLVEVDRGTAVSGPSPGHRRRLVLVHRVRWDPSSSWSGHPYFERKKNSPFPSAEEHPQIASLLASQQSVSHDKPYDASRRNQQQRLKNSYGLLSWNGSRGHALHSLVFPPPPHLTSINAARLTLANHRVRGS